VQVRGLPGSPRGRTAMGAVSRLENGWISGSWGFDSLSFRLEAWPSWKGSALLARRRRRRSQVRVLLPPSLRRRSNGRTPGCYPVDAGSSPAVAALTPRSCPQTRDPQSGSRVAKTPEAGRFAAGWAIVNVVSSCSRTRLGCGPAVSRVRRVRSPSRASSRRRSVDEHHAPTVAHGGSNPPGETASQG
jgi:hypothetical protein